MSRVTWKQAVAGIALLATFALVAPAPAQATVLGAGGHDSWSVGRTWMAFLWERLATIFGIGRAPQAPMGATPHGLVQKSAADAAGDISWTDTGPTINPDGEP
jgi:hypothetical protein